MKSTNSEINWNNSRQETGDDFTIKYTSKEKKIDCCIYFTQIHFTVMLSSKNGYLHRIYTASDIQGNI